MKTFKDISLIITTFATILSIMIMLEQRKVTEKREALIIEVYEEVLRGK